MNNKVKFVLLLVILALVLVACGSNNTYSGQGSSQKQEAQITEQTQGRLLASNPPPTITYSLERANLSERLTRFNDRNKLSYITLITLNGQVVANLVVKGKVSSLNSLLTTPDQIVDDPYKYQSGGQVVASPDLDGSYGDNPEGIFFFTPENVYVEWTGDYFLTDQPMSISVEPIMLAVEPK